MSVRFESLAVGDALPTRRHTPTEVTLFLYNAAVWNAHRIHYDAPYTTAVEGHPAIVIDGPLQGDWLAQTVTNWIGAAGRMTTFSYSNRRAAYLPQTLTSGGRIVAIDAATRTVTLELAVTNAQGEITTPGSAVVRFRGR